MEDQEKTTEQLVSELGKLRQRIAELGAFEAEHKRVEKALRDNEERYRALSNASFEAIFISEKGICIDTNQTATEMFGYDYDEFIGIFGTDVIAPESKELVNHYMLSGYEEPYEAIAQRKDGTTFEVEIRGKMTEYKGRSVRVTVVHNIDKRKQAEEALQQKITELDSFLNNIPDMAWLKDMESRFIAVNQAFGEAVDMDPESLLNQTCEVCFGEEEGKKFQEDDWKVIESGKQQVLEEQIVDSRGREVWLETIKSPILDKSGKVRGTVGIAREITKRKQAEKALRKAHTELERRVEERTAELVKLNETLKQEIEERKQIEQKLRKREAELKIQASELEELNTALRVLLKRREEDKVDVEEKTLSNVKELVLPYIERLRRSGLDAKQTTYVSILESNLNDIVSPLSHKLSSKYLSLTPTEIQIANLVKGGKTTKEIAEILHSSARTVEFHRNNIRKKIGIKNSKANLRSHLLSM